MVIDGDGPKPIKEKKLIEENILNDPVLQDEKVCFKSFKIIRVLGAGSFGKVFLVK